MRCEIVRDDAGLAGLGAAWDALAAEARVGLFLSHRWLRAWWRAYRGVDEMWLLTAHDGPRLAAGWPLHLRAPRSQVSYGPIKVAELRLVGELGAGQRSLVCAPPDRERAVTGFVELLARTRGWDVLDVPVVSARVADLIVESAVASGLKAERLEESERKHVELPSVAEWAEIEGRRRPARPVGDARDVPADEVRDALDTLLKLIRKEWAARDATNPAVDSQAGQFLHDVVPELVERGLLRIGQIAAGGQVVASDLVARDGDRHVRLLAGVDPEQQKSSVPLELLLASLRAAVQAGGRRFELGSDDDEPGEHIRTTPSKVLRARLWSGSTTAKLHRGVQAVQALRGGPAARGGTLGTIERLQKAAPEVLQRALGRVAQVTTLHLYRGELFWRDVREAGDLSLKLFSLAEFEALAERARDELAARLDLAIGYCRQKWSRGDTVVLAEVAGRPAGILWCARSAVYVPDIGREVRPGPGECYIHDVYVHPDERGRQVAPAMLDFLARELRARDVYRAWALIERSNSPSVRAFEKAAYASVSDVVYARIGLLSRLIVRPPDPEARAFLGLT